MRYGKLFGLALVVVFALGALVATTASAAITGGPLWKTANGVLPKNTTSMSLTAFTLETAALTVTCKKVKDTGTIKSEGLDTTNVFFEECEALGTGLTKCLATGVEDTPATGNIDVLELTTKLMYPDNTGLGSEKEALDGFFPKPTAKENTFAEFKLKADAGGTCAILEGRTVIVKAAGTEVTKPEAIDKKLGVLAKVGKDDGGTPPVFLTTVSGELTKLGALFLPPLKEVIKSALNCTSNTKCNEAAGVQLVTAELLAGEEVAAEAGFTMVETEPAEEFGWMVN